VSHREKTFLSDAQLHELAMYSACLDGREERISSNLVDITFSDTLNSRRFLWRIFFNDLYKVLNRLRNSAIVGERKPEHMGCTPAFVRVKNIGY